MRCALGGAWLAKYRAMQTHSDTDTHPDAHGDAGADDSADANTPAYDQLVKLFQRLHHLEHLQAIAYWDQAAMMPRGSSEARAGALAEVATQMHRLRTDPGLPDLLARAQHEPLTDHQRANLREIQREWRAANALPRSPGAAHPVGHLAL